MGNDVKNEESKSLYPLQLLSHATASLGIALIHSKPYQPEGRGKIERWFSHCRS